MATLGPASSDEAVMQKMVEAGVDVFRLNFSHGTHQEHTARLESIRRIANETGRQLAVLQDLCGPKIRLGRVAGDLLACDHDAEFLLSSDTNESDDPTHLTSTYRSLPDDLEVGQTVLFADGTVAMNVIVARSWLGPAEGHPAWTHPLKSGYQRSASRAERRGLDR